MIASRQPACWDGPPTRLCFLESLEAASSAVASPLGAAAGSWSPTVSGFTHHAERVGWALRLSLAAKRGIDCLGGAVGLLVSLPVLALAAIAIRLEDGGPVFYPQQRCGRHGRLFRMLKLRTMVVGAEGLQKQLEDRNQMDGPVFKMEDDPRVTRVGDVLRRFSIDELPQFLNVLWGDMSLVGPRPPLPSEVARYGPRERRRLTVKPGLTCTWQVSGRNNIPFEEWVRLDLDYIDRWSLRRDLLLIARTVPAVLRGDGAS